MRALLGVVVLVLVVGCSSGPELDGKTFASTSVEGHDLVEGSTIELAFEEGRLTVSAGCNAMSADYEVDDGTLAWSGESMSTLIGCPEDMAAQDQWLTELFTDGVDAELDGSTLTLSDDDLEITLEEQ